MHWGLSLGLCATVMLATGGCSQEGVQERVQEAENAAGQAAAKIAEDAGKVVKEGQELAGELGEKAVAFLTPLKEKFGDLEDLKTKPKELKQAVAELLQSIEQKTADIQLPEAASNALATAKEKLTALKNDLDGEIEQAKIDEHIKEILEAVRAKLGVSDG
jgi:hypothetical protein